MPSDPITGPLYLENDRPFIDLVVAGEHGRADGRFLVDTGGGGVLLTKELATQAGLAVAGRTDVEEWGVQLEEISVPPLTFAGQVIRADSPAYVILREVVGGPRNMISGRALSRYRVVFDFPSRLFELYDPNEADPEERGIPLPTPIHPTTMFPRIEVTVAGRVYGMLLDTGAGCTMISPHLLDAWRQEHPGWQFVEGARGSAIKGRTDLDEGAVMVRVPELSLGPFQLRDVWTVARRRGGNYEAFSERMMTGPAVGALGGNVLKEFRVEIDCALGCTYLRPSS